ncbi:MAG: hypothetical protein ACRENU_04350, partial [Gemmatimonadaceae bacterium]
PCLEPGPPTMEKDSTLATILYQIGMNAEQYKLLTKRYPFYYVHEAVRSSRDKKGGKTRIDAHELRQQDGRTESRYSAGRVVARRYGRSFFQIPGLMDFADPDFMLNHCFHVRGTEIVGDEVLIRVDVVAAERIKTPDVNGSIYLDPGSFQVTRTVLRLSKVTRDIDYLTDFEIVTLFREIMPSISIIGSVSSTQTIDPKSRMQIDTAWETLKLVGYQFVKDKPGDEVRKPQP